MKYDSNTRRERARTLIVVGILTLVLIGVYYILLFG